MAAVRTKYPHGPETWTGPTTIDAELRTSRVLKDAWVVSGSLKHYQDGICDKLLPLGDGPKTPYVWQPPTQVRVVRRTDEGVLFRIDGS